MKIFKLLFLGCFFLWGHSTIVENHLKVFTLFNIDLNKENMALIQDFRKSIDFHDTKELMSALNGNTRNAYMIYNELKNTKAPEFLLYLAVSESKLKNNAKSSVKATGVWQFMRPTAKHYGLKINTELDERIDPIASTDAAVRYLNYLNKMFGKWYLAVMAYNCGEGKLLKIIKKTGNDEFLSLMNSPFLPGETKMFMKKIIKMTYIGENQNIENYFKNLQKPNELIKVDVKAGTKLVQFSRLAGVDYDKLKKLNPHLLKSKAPKDQNYHFYLPKNYLASYNEKIAKMPKYEIYLVKNGDTLSHIAQKFGIGKDYIKNENNLKNDNIKINQELLIPVLEISSIKNGKKVAKI